MRYDYFMIWGNGMYHTQEIIKMIDEEPNFKVLYIKEHDVNNLDTFVKGIYKCDTVPWEHLIAKSRYLMQAPKKVVFILTENLEPDEKYFGGGPFRHIQCQKVKDLKTKVRNKFNPPFANPEQRLAPLDKGVSHEHVLHGSDYESQVSYTLNFLHLPNLDYFRKFSNKVDVRMFLANMPNYAVLKIWEDFPNYMGFNDIDLLCENRQSCIDHIRTLGKIYQDKGWRIATTNTNNHCHIDFIPPNADRLDFRFDLIDDLNKAFRTKLKPEFTSNMLSEKVKLNGINIPKIEHDLAVRYLEYKEHIHERPDKIKHLNYCKKFENVDYNAELNKYKL